MATLQERTVPALYARAEHAFDRWEKTKDLVDEMIDLALNYRQSGHPGGSRSKVHMLLSLMLSGAMRWDLLRPWLRFGDRFVLSAGHTVPLVYATLAVLNEAVRARHAADGDPAFAYPFEGRFALTWEDLLLLRRNKGLPGHAEFAGKTLFLKANTGPSGHGMPPSVGQAVALKLAGAEEVKVFVFEGEGGLTPGASHESKNSAWGLGLSNLVFLVDWNDFGIDENALSSVVHGVPEDWFAPYGWRVMGTEHGSEWDPVTRTVLEVARGENAGKTPSMAWFKTRKGRGYGKYDYKSHGTPHPMNSEPFWTVRKQFMAKYGIEYEGVDQPPPKDAAEVRRQARRNLEIAAGVLRGDAALVEYLSDRLREVAAEVPQRLPSFYLGGKAARVFDDERLYDFERYPDAMWAKPGDKKANRAALATWGAWINSFARKEYGRPLFIAMSADLAESTNIAGFAKGFDDVEGWGWYERDRNPRGALLPQQITEFTNAGVACGIASVNVAEDPFADFDGFYGACSTYGSFSYLKYGEMRLFSQLAQDCELRVGRVLWVAGHSGPETAEDSRTHFGIFETGVTQLFPDGQVIDVHPWEHNEVPVVLAAAFRTRAPIVALHLTRPAVEIPDRARLGMPSHFAAAKGAYVLREFAPGERHGTVFVQGTMTTANLVKVLPKLGERGLNVKVVAAISPQLFALQDAAYRERTVSLADWHDAMTITNRALRTMRDWIRNDLVAEYSLTSDWDHRWRTGGTVDEVIAEAHLDPEHLLAGIERFVRERPRRLAALRDAAEAAARHDGPGGRSG
ncbi:MAG TPA: transketolase [Candidatus Dormibacteraeota bacterium]|nr:transketolase [Candidatus Dormibacteraeota bacterium]